MEAELLWFWAENAAGEIDSAPSVWILDDRDYDRALEIVKDLSRSSEAPCQSGSDWRCAKCGEMNERIFSECWNCGKERPI